MTPIWKSLIFGEKGTSNYQEKTFRQKLITELSKTNQNGSFTNSFSDNNDLLMNTFTFFISSIFENNYNLVLKNEAAMNLLKKNKVEHDIEMDKKKKAVHDLEMKLNTCKKKLKENFDKNNQNFEEIEALKDSCKTKDIYIKKLKTTNSSEISKLDNKIKNLSDKVEEYESDKIDKRKTISGLEKKLGEQNKMLKSISCRVENVQNEATHVKNIEKKIDNDSIKLPISLNNDKISETFTSNQEEEHSINKLHTIQSNVSSCESEAEKCDLQPPTGPIEGGLPIPESTSQNKRKKNRKNKKNKTNDDHQMLEVDSKKVDPAPLTYNIRYNSNTKKFTVKSKKKRTIRNFLKEKNMEKYLTESFREFQGAEQ